MPCLLYTSIDEIVYGLINIINTFNPPAMVLGGGILNEKYIIEEIEKRLRPCLMPSFCHVQIRQAALGNKAGMIGATYFALNFEKFTQ